MQSVTREGSAANAALTSSLVQLDQGKMSLPNTRVICMRRVKRGRVGFQSGKCYTVTPPSATLLTVVQEALLLHIRTARQHGLREARAVVQEPGAVAVALLLGVPRDAADEGRVGARSRVLQPVQARLRGGVLRSVVVCQLEPPRLQVRRLGPPRAIGPIVRHGCKRPQVGTGVCVCVWGGGRINQRGRAGAGAGCSGCANIAARALPHASVTQHTPAAASNTKNTDERRQATSRLRSFLLWACLMPFVP